MLMNKTGRTRTIAEMTDETELRAREVLHPREVTASEEPDERILPSRPVLSYEEELKRLDKEREENKWLILQGRYDFVEKDRRRQWLMKKLAGPIRSPGPVPIQRMDQTIITGFENANSLNNTGK